MWLWLFACGGDELVPERFNADEQDLTVLVKDDCTDEEAAPVQIPLLSAVGRIEVGFAEIEPGCAPLGSDHVLFVEVYDEYQDLIDEARVTAIPQAVSDLDGDGEDEARDRSTYVIPRDGADSGVFAITLRSRGARGEMREDRWRVSLLVFAEEEERDGGLLGPLGPLTQ